MDIMEIMKRHKRTLLLLTLAVCVFGPTPVHARTPLENGVQREYFSNGKLRWELVRKNGMTVRRRTFYRNGRLLLEERYKNGQLYLKRTFYDNGNRKSLWTKKSGQTRFYHRDGSFRLAVDRPGG